MYVLAVVPLGEDGAAVLDVRLGRRAVGDDGAAAVDLLMQCLGHWPPLMRRAALQFRRALAAAAAGGLSCTVVLSPPQAEHGSILDASAGHVTVSELNMGWRQ